MTHGFATSLWTNVMMDARKKKKKKNIFYDKMSKEINWIVRKWLIVL